jgi:hypothetical protein
VNNLKKISWIDLIFQLGKLDRLEAAELAASILSYASNVAYWHKADVAITSPNVCSERQNGHAANIAFWSLLTHSGHRASFATV